MKKFLCSLICLSVFLAISADAKPVKKAKKEDQTILLRVRVNGKEMKVVNVPMKAKGLKLTINPTDMAKALEKPAAKPETKKVEAPAVPAPSVTEEKAPSIAETGDDDDGITETPEVPSESRKETRSDLAPAPAVPIPTEPSAKHESHFYEKWWFWTAVGVITAATVWKIGDHNHWWDIHISSGRRR